MGQLLKNIWPVGQLFGPFGCFLLTLFAETNDTGQIFGPLARFSKNIWPIKIEKFWKN